MKILYVWDGAKDLPESRVKAIEGTISLYPDAEYFCITKENRFLDMQVISWWEVLDAMKRIFHFKETPYRWHNPMCFSDWARFWFLSSCRDCLYLDTDCEMKQVYPFERAEKVLYSPGNICLLYAPSNGAASNMDRYIREQASRKINLLMSLPKQFPAEWSDPIASEVFAHG